MLGPHENDDNLRALKHRIATFKDVWPFLEDCNCTPEKMAEAGFYHVGSDSEPDLVRCYYCRRELDGWEPTDIPWDEHKRRECPYISLGKIPQSLTIEDTFDLEAARKCIIVREAAKREVEKFREYAKDQKGKIQALGAIQGAKKRGRKKKTKY